MRWLRRHGSALLKRPTARRLRVAETVSLGEKRFVSIIEVDGEQFLLGGSGSAVTLLAKLESSQRTPQQAQRCSFGDVYSQLCTQEYDANGSANRVGELPK
ncbi:MAG TPA: flagellar biosynthetic protein FliO [Acidobacteriaceae bacterium]|jgi:flagellar biogenesis protein FliO